METVKRPLCGFCGSNQTYLAPVQKGMIPELFPPSPDPSVPSLRPEDYPILALLCDNCRKNGSWSIKYGHTNHWVKPIENMPGDVITYEWA